MAAQADPCYHVDNCETMKRKDIPLFTWEGSNLATLVLKKYLNVEVVILTLSDPVLRYSY